MFLKASTCTSDSSNVLQYLCAFSMERSKRIDATVRHVEVAGHNTVMTETLQRDGLHSHEVPSVIGAPTSVNRGNYDTHSKARMRNSTLRVWS